MKTPMILWSFLACSQKYEVSSPTVEMPDGTLLAVDVITPADRDGPVPAVLIQTRYWRSFDLAIRRGEDALPIGPREDIAKALLRAGYAVVVADVRGTGASEGSWPRPWSEQEVADMGALVDWVAAQPWCDGRLGAEGVSYEGTTALLAATQGRSELKAVLAREIEWDLVDELLAPGGVRNISFVESWGESVALLDAGEVPDLFRSGAAFMIKGPARTDADPEGTILEEVLANREIPDVASDVSQIRSPKDLWGDGTPASEVGPSAWLEELAASPSAIGIWGSWWDGATADAVLRADAALSLADARIGGWTHEGNKSASPLGGSRDSEVDLDEVVGFFDAWLRGDGRAPVRQWYVAGPEALESGTQWPETSPKALYLRQDHTLGASDPSLRRTLAVDFEASVGDETRWSTGLLTDVEAPNREKAPGLLSFASGPLSGTLSAFGEGLFACDLETEGEAALHVYLEAVQPNGRVRLLTEGLRRVKTGRVEVPLRPVAFELEPDWAIRLSIAGADAETFERVPASGPQSITLLGADCRLEIAER